MNKPTESRVKLPRARIFGTVLVLGVFLVLIGYVVSSVILWVSGWVLMAVGGGSLAILMRTRTYRMH